MIERCRGLDKISEWPHYEMCGAAATNTWVSPKDQKEIPLCKKHYDQWKKIAREMYHGR